MYLVRSTIGTFHKFHRTLTIVFRSIAILATNRFMQFYVFEFADDYFQYYENRAMGTSGCSLKVHSTKWIDLQSEDHRRNLQHIGAALRWANTL